MAELDALDRKLLNLVQTDFPLVSRPYAALADGLGIGEFDVVRRLETLRRDKILREVSAIFDSRALGYDSALVAAECPAEGHEAAADIVSEHPGVSHNYRREHAFDLWFTLAVPEDGDLSEEAERLSTRAGFRRWMVLPAIRTFRVGVAFDLESGKARGMKDEKRADVERPFGREPKVLLNAEDKAAVRRLQENLPMVERPFLTAARSMGWTEEELFAWIERAKRLGWMRRFAAALWHREAGFGEGGMGVWAVPPDSIERLGRSFAVEPAVTHCYQRPTFRDWPYSLFTMVHGGNREECEGILESLARRADGWTRRRVLFSTHEYKKERGKYFLEEQIRPHHAADDA